MGSDYKRKINLQIGTAKKHKKISEMPKARDLIATKLKIGYTVKVTRRDVVVVV